MAGGHRLETIPAFLTRAPGTYALALHLDTPTRCAIGALAQVSLPAGVYLYIGSAWGSGGMRARLGRHLRGASVLHWHIDYLRQATRPLAVWIAEGEHLECVWADHLLHAPGAEILVPHFGASDCACATHLVHLTSLPTSLNLPRARGPFWLQSHKDMEP